MAWGTLARGQGKRAKPQCGRHSWQRSVSGAGSRGRAASRPRYRPRSSAREGLAPSQEQTQVQINPGGAVRALGSRTSSDGADMRAQSVGLLEPAQSWPASPWPVPLHVNRLQHARGRAAPFLAGHGLSQLLLNPWPSARIITISG